MNAVALYSEKDDRMLELLRKHFGKELSEEELELFGLICQRTQLDPFIKQIYPIPRKNKQSDGSYRTAMVIQVGIDGLRSIAERTGGYSPGKEPSYAYDDKKNLVSATSHIKKMTPDGTWHEVSATAFMREYRPKFGNFWDNMPHLMLAKCAEALAIRKAFPAQTCKLYIPEEMEQAKLESEMEPKAVSPQQERKQIDPGAKEELLEAVPEPDSDFDMTPFEQLKEHLIVEGVPSERLAEWVKMRAQTKNQPEAHIIKTCLEKANLPIFKKAFSKFIGYAPEELAV